MKNTFIAALLALGATGIHAADPIAFQAEQIFRSSFRADNPRYWIIKWHALFFIIILFDYEVCLFVYAVYWRLADTYFTCQPVFHF